MSKPRKMVLYVSEACEHCDEAMQAIDEIRKEEGISVEVRNLDIMEIPPVTTAPSVCVVDDKGEPVECVLGIVSKEEFKSKVKHLIGSDVVV